jgi:hypothetical protein
MMNRNIANVPIVPVSCKKIRVKELSSIALNAAASCIVMNNGYAQTSGKKLILMNTVMMAV